MSKIPPQLRESVAALLQTSTAFTLRHFLRALRPFESLENLLSASQHFVECILEIRRAFGELLSYLRNILFKTLFYLISKELFESTITQTFRVLRRMVGDDVRDQRARETPGALTGILGKKWIHGSTRPAIACGGRRSGRSHRRAR